MAGGAASHLPAARWLGAAGRALGFGAAVLLLEGVVHSLCAPLAPAGTQAGMAWYTGGTLLSALVVGVVLLRLLDDRPAGALGFAWSRQVPREVGVGVVAGVLPQLAIALLLLAGGGLAFGADTGSGWEWAGEREQGVTGADRRGSAEETAIPRLRVQALVRGFGR
jgi:hypothetical protein